MPSFDGYVSRNPKFVSFSTVPENITVEFDGVVQESHEVMKRLMETKSAMQGYGIGYAGTDVAGNISYDGPDVPFSTPLKNIPWGRAALCKITKTDATEEGGETIPAKITLTSLNEPGDEWGIVGTCYGTTIKDNSVQLNCGFSVGDSVTPDEQSDAFVLAIAVFANAKLDEGTMVFDEGDTVVAISEAIDPSIFSKNLPWTFEVPDDIAGGGECGFVFTARGNLLVSPSNCPAPTHTSFWDAVTNLSPNVLIDGLNPNEL